MRRSALCAIAAGTLALYACNRSGSITPDTSTFYYGHIIHGSAFGISVGTKREVAKAILDRRFPYIGPVGCGSELHDLISCKSDLTADLYEGHEFLRTHGNVYVIYSGDTVKAVAWQFYLLPYIDT